VAAYALRGERHSHEDEARSTTRDQSGSVLAFDPVAREDIPATLFCIFSLRTGTPYSVPFVHADLRLLFHSSQ